MLRQNAQIRRIGPGNQSECSAAGIFFWLGELYTMQVFSDGKNPGNADPAQLTLLLNRMQQGDREAGDQAASLVYAELHRLASGQMRRERPDHTLQTTALVHEAYLRMIEAGALDIQSRGHFFALASHQMRRILVDHARQAHARKRGGDVVKTGLDEVRIGTGEQDIDLLALNEALDELERLAPRAVRVVELRFFGGYTDKEVAEALGISFAMVRREWAYASSWLFDRMGNAPKNQSIKST